MYTTFTIIEDILQLVYNNTWLYFNVGKKIQQLNMQ